MSCEASTLHARSLKIGISDPPFKSNQDYNVLC